MPNQPLNTVFVKNRAEEIGSDVWNEFVIPPFYDQLISDVQEARKPVVIRGGRGCGKTMLLRYWSHESTFSPDRSVVPKKSLESIGVYWKADTQFAHILFGRDVAQEEWITAFDHLIAVKVGIEILRSLESISRCEINELKPEEKSITERDLSNLVFKNISEIGDEKLKGKCVDIRNTLESQYRLLRRWSNNLNLTDRPLFYPCRIFLQTLIDEIREKFPCLNGSVFKVYIDEYENLRPYQQHVINTLIKHSEVPLIFNVAVKQNAMTDLATLGAESIRDKHDFRVIDIEEYAKDTFNNFAGEIMYRKLCLQNIKYDHKGIERFGISEQQSRQSGHLNKEQVSDAVKRILPSLDYKQMALECITDQTIYAILSSEIRDALHIAGSQISPESFIDKNFPQESIVCSSLLFRKNPGIEDIHKEFCLLQSNKRNKFTSTTDWTNNNFVGAYLRLFQHRIHKCPFYAGFDAYCAMSRGNLRNFLDLCHNAVKRYSRESENISVSILEQAYAAYLVSDSCVRDIRSCGYLGNKLHAMVLTLGELFALSQQRKTQSEPEISHFAFSSGDFPQPDDQEILNEAIKWSVLFEEDETKVKDSIDPHPVQWVLNPIYAPYFHISYRKIRKLELSLNDLHILLNGSYEERKSLLQRFQKKWELDNPLQPHLPGLE